MVPMEELEGRMDGESHRLLVKSSALAGIILHSARTSTRSMLTMLFLCQQV